MCLCTFHRNNLGKNITVTKRGTIVMNTNQFFNNNNKKWWTFYVINFVLNNLKVEDEFRPYILRPFAIKDYDAHFQFSWVERRWHCRLCTTVWNSHCYFFTLNHLKISCCTAAHISHSISVLAFAWVAKQLPWYQFRKKKLREFSRRKSFPSNTEKGTKKKLYLFILLKDIAIVEISLQLPAGLHHFHHIIVLNNIVKAVYSLFLFHSIFQCHNKRFLRSIISWLSVKKNKWLKQDKKRKNHHLWRQQQPRATKCNKSNLDN